MPEPPKPTAEHQLLKSFVGEWDCEMESMDPKNPMKHKCTMSGKMIGDYWASVTFKGDMMGTSFVGQGTFGFDRKTKKANGTWVSSMDDYLWTYDGKIDGKKFILDANGPSPMDPTKIIAYRDTWDFSKPDTMVLTSEFTGPDGKMMKMMQATGVRKK